MKNGYLFLNYREKTWNFIFRSFNFKHRVL